MKDMCNKLIRYISYQLYLFSSPSYHLQNSMLRHLTALFATSDSLPSVLLLYLHYFKCAVE